MERNERVKKIVEEAAALPEEERKAYLDMACGKDPELREQVEAELERAGLIGQPTLSIDKKALSKRESQAIQGRHPKVAGEAPGERMGPYELLEKIGEGGFGTVWKAQQREPIKRRVALKIIKLGMDTKEVIARFEAERQALALMDHPGIARVIDAGSTESGRPYFVMELVDGIRLDTYCDQNQLSIRERIELFIQVCHAVQHAHQKGIIHRDLKPSNVLVTLQDGAPLTKVIDFGIAKATHAELTQKTIYTQVGEIIGAPVYMSPEQVEMTGLDIDTRSDIYSLGVMLYELLTGTLPFDLKEITLKGIIEMIRILREEEPETPSKRALQHKEKITETAARRQTNVKQLALTLKGDLDWIVMKCLEKDRTQRYETASSLAEDLERYLKHEPVRARPPSAAYKMRKFVLRNRTWVIAGTAIVTILVLGIIGTTLGMIRAKRALRELGKAHTKLEKALSEVEAVTVFQENQSRR